MTCLSTARLWLHFFVEIEVRRVTNKGLRTAQRIIALQAEAILRAKKSINFGEKIGHMTLLICFCELIVHQLSTKSSPLTKFFKSISPVQSVNSVHNHCVSSTELIAEAGPTVNNAIL